MNERRTLWLSMTAALWAGSSAFSPLVAQDGAHAMHGDEAAAAQPAAHGMHVGDGEGEGGGDPGVLENNGAFLERLGLIRGHLQVGNALYQAGHTAMAATHMKHPRDELYAGLVPAIRARDAATFDDELSALAEAVESGADAGEVQAAWEAVDGAIQAIEDRVDASVELQLLALAKVVREAGKEFALGVVDGRVVNTHEYQDAWGFTQVAARRLAAMEATDRAEQSAIARATAFVETLEPLWPSLAPDGPVQGRAVDLHGVAARLELIAYGLQSPDEIPGEPER